MPAFLDHILSRRGRKNAHETQLNPVWGDVQITSPTDSIKVGEGKNSGTTLGIVEQHFANLDHGAILMRGVCSNSPSLSAMPMRSSKNNYSAAKSNSNYATFTTGLPSPGQTPTLSPSQFGSATQQVSPTPASPKSPQAVLEDALKDKGYYTNAIAVYDTTPPLEQEEYSAFNTLGRAGNPLPISPADTEQHTERAVYVSNRRPLSPTEIAALIQRPKRSDGLRHDNPQTTPKSHFSSLNAAAVESVHSPIVTILSPVSEVFGLEGHGSPIDDIKIVHDATCNSIQQDMKTAPLCLDSNAVDLRNQESQKDVVIESDLSSPLLSSDPQTTTLSSNPLTSHPSLCSRSPLPIVESRINSRLISEPNQATANSPGAQVSTSYASSPRHRASSYESTNSRTTSRNLADAHSPVVSDLSRTHSPRLGVTEVMRMRSPPLGSTARMRIQSPPLGVGTDKTMHIRKLSDEMDTMPRSSSPVNREITIPVRHRQRRNTLEPPASPSYFQTTAPSTLNSSISSDLAVTHVLLVGDPEYARNNTNPSAPIQSEFPKDDLPPLLKRSRSQAALVSPDLRKRHAFSSSPVLTFETKISNPATKGLYSEIADDYRKLSREAFVAKYAATSGKTQSATKRKQHSRARSVSRNRSKPTQRIPDEEVMVSNQRKSLVPGYEEMWC